MACAKLSNKITNQKTERSNMEPVDRELEEIVLKESIVGATGLNAASIQVGIKGDQSMRETVIGRERYASLMDQYFPTIEPHLEDMLLHRSCYRLYIGFNNGEIRTNSLFDPFRIEIHSAEKIADAEYVARQFPEIGFERKAQTIREVNEALEKSAVYETLPGYWRRIVRSRNEAWQPMDPAEIPTIIKSLSMLRNLEQYYLRNVSICVVTGIVHMSFNCDGTQLVKCEDYLRFLEENAMEIG